LWEPVGVVVLSGPAVSTQQAGVVVGTPSNDACPANEVVIGYQGFLSSAGFANPPGPVTHVVSVIQTLCGVPALGGPTLSAITVTPGTTLGARGSDRGMPWSAPCPPNEIVEGFSGRVGFYLDQIQFVCANWTLATATAADAGTGLSMDHTSLLTAAGGSGGTPFPLQTCPPGQMATGSAVQAGQFVSAFGLICSSPSIQ
jgi:hypothetical protein